MSTMSAGDLLWTEATRDVEAEHEAMILASASVAAAPIWATVLAAESDADFHNRIALLEQPLQAVASSIAPMGTPDHSLVVTALPAQWYEDWKLAFEARQAEAQKANARRAFERNAARQKTAGMVNLGNPSGSVAPGDDVLAGQAGAVVTRVIVHPPGKHPKGAPIVDDMYAVEVQTSNGATRWCGGTKAEIGPDLRVHWSRPDTRSASKTAATPTGRSDYQPGSLFSGGPQADPDAFSSEDILAEIKYLMALNKRHGPHELRTMAYLDLLRVLKDRGYTGETKTAAGFPFPVIDSMKLLADKTLDEVDNWYRQGVITQDQFEAYMHVWAEDPSHAGYGPGQGWTDKNYSTPEVARLVEEFKAITGIASKTASDKPYDPRDEGGSPARAMEKAFGDLDWDDIKAGWAKQDAAKAKTAAATEVSGSTIQEAVAKAQQGMAAGAPPSLFVVNVNGDRRVVEVMPPAFGPQYSDMGSYESFYGTTASLSEDDLDDIAITAGGLDFFWEGVDAQAGEIKGSRSAADVISKCQPPSSGDGFWAGDGDDLMGILFDSGWRAVEIQAPYLWCMEAPDGSKLTYVEGDLYKGNSLMANSSKTAGTGPNGFWCRYCGDYQSCITPAQVKVMRAHMKKHEEAGHVPAGPFAETGDRFPAKNPSQRVSAAGDPPNIATCRKVLAEGFYAGGEVIDQFSASAIVQVYDQLNDENKAKFGSLSLPRMADIAFKLSKSAGFETGWVDKTLCEACQGRGTDTNWDICKSCGGHGYHYSQEKKTAGFENHCATCGDPIEQVEGRGWTHRAEFGDKGHKPTPKEASKTAENSFPPKNDLEDPAAAADPAPAAPGAPQPAADPMVDVATVQVGGVIMEPGEGVVNTYEIKDAQDAGDSMLLTVTKNGTEEMQLQIPKTEKVQIHQPAGETKPKEDPAAATEAPPAAGEEAKEKKPFPPKAAAFGETSPEKKKDAYDKQQAEMGERKKVTNDSMRAAYEKAKADGDEGMAEFWKDYLQERGIEVDASKTASDQWAKKPDRVKLNDGRMATVVGSDPDGQGSFTLVAEVIETGEVIKGLRPADVEVTDSSYVNMGADRTYDWVDEQMGKQNSPKTAALTCPKCGEDVSSHATVQPSPDGKTAPGTGAVLSMSCPSCGWSGTKGKGRTSDLHDAVIERAARIVLAEGNPFTDDNPYKGDNAADAVANPGTGDAAPQRDTEDEA